MRTDQRASTIRQRWCTCARPAPTIRDLSGHHSSLSDLPLIRLLSVASPLGQRQAHQALQLLRAPWRLFREFFVFVIFVVIVRCELALRLSRSASGLPQHLGSRGRRLSHLEQAFGFFLAFGFFSQASSPPTPLLFFFLIRGLVRRLISAWAAARKNGEPRARACEPTKAAPEG